MHNPKVRTLPKLEKKVPARGYALAWLVLMISLVTAVTVWGFARARIERGAHARFVFRTIEIQNQIAHRMHAYEAMLRSGAGMMAIHPDTTRADWQQFINGLKLDENYPGILGIGYAQSVRPEQKEAFVRKVQDQGFPHFSVWPAGQRREYTAIIYLEPFNWRNRRAFGYDMFSEPIRNAAMVKARDSGTIATSGMVTLVQETNKDVQKDFLMYMPVYRKNASHTTIAERGAALVGYVYASFRMNDLIHGSWQQHRPPEIGLEIDDGAQPTAAGRMFTSGTVANAAFTRDVTLDVGQHLWTLHFFSTPAFEANYDRYDSPAILITGSVLSLLLFAIAWSLSTMHRRALALAHEMTQEARQAEAKLRDSERFRALFDYANDGLILLDPDGVIIEMNHVACDSLDYSPTALIGTNYAALVESLESPVRAIKAKLEEGGQGFMTEAVHLRKDGSAFPASIAFSLFQYDQRPLILASIRDITVRKKAEEELQRTQQFLNAIVDNIPTAVFVKDAKDLRQLLVNKACEELTGWPRQERIGKNDYDLFPADEADLYTSADRDALANRTLVDIPEETVHTRHKGIRWLHTRKVPIIGANGEPEYLLGISEDITEQKRAQLLLEDSHQRYKSLFEHHPDAVYSFDRESRFTSLNQQCVTLTGYAPETLLGQSYVDLPLPEDRERVLRHFQLALTGKMQCYECRIKHKAGHILLLHVTNQPIISRGEIVGVYGIAKDITQARHNEERLAHLARFDSLTDLPNRYFFLEQLKQTFARECTEHQLIALFCIDLDKFTAINDAHGHEIGSQVLLQMGGRLKKLLRDGDVVGRLEGDQFVVLLENITDQQAVHGIADRIRNELAAPFYIGSLEIFLTASIGIAIYPCDNEEMGELLRNADLAMYQAKIRGGNNYQFYTSDTKHQLTRKLALTTELRYALARNELEVYYQPLIDAQSLTIVGVEALLRWNHPTSGSVPPDRFIPLAEEAGLIVPIGEWVLKTACQQIKAWHMAGLPKVTVSINVSIRQLRENDFVQMVRQTLHNCDLEPQYLELELTESLLMQNVKEVAASLHELCTWGVRFAIDDFGTGYSSLNYIRHLPIQSIKIDRSFVAHIISEPDDAAIVTASIAMAHKMKLKVVAEGVETQSQLNYLRLNECDKVQGYHFSPPVSVDAMAKLLGERRVWHLGEMREDSAANTLLIVDDEPNITASLRRALRPDNYRILVAHSAAEGFELLASHPTGVILSDQRMPQMNGSEFLSRVRELYPNTIRMVLSGYTELNSITEAINRGAIYKFLTKPWETEELRETVREAFYRYRCNSEASESLRMMD